MAVGVSSLIMTMMDMSVGVVIATIMGMVRADRA
jgi:hypothetical protein